MSRTPHPVAATSAMLMQRAFLLSVHAYTNANPSRIASLASDLHRLAKGCHRQAEVECNGEYHDGQRNALSRAPRGDEWVKRMEGQIIKTGSRLDKRIAQFNQSLAILSIEAHRTGDPRGFTLRLRSTDPAGPMPSNGMEQGEWGVG